MSADLEFVDPPSRGSDETETLRALMDHPKRWARVAVSAHPHVRRRWDDARRRVGAQGEFKVRQASIGPDSPLIDVYVKYEPERES